MKLHRITAIVFRHLYLYRRSLPRIMEIFYWPFLDLESLIGKPESSPDKRRADLGKQLEVASALAFKIWKLNWILRWFSRAGAVAAVVLLVWFIYMHWDAELPFPRVSTGGLTTFIALLVAGIFFPLINWLNPQKAVSGYLRKALIAVVGFVQLS